MDNPWTSKVRNLVLAAAAIGLIAGTTAASQQRDKGNVERELTALFEVVDQKETLRFGILVGTGQQVSNEEGSLRHAMKSLDATGRFDYAHFPQSLTDADVIFYFLDGWGAVADIPNANDVLKPIVDDLITNPPNRVLDLKSVIFDQPKLDGTAGKVPVIFVFMDRNRYEDTCSNEEVARAFLKLFDPNIPVQQRVDQQELNRCSV